MQALTKSMSKPVPASTSLKPPVIPQVIIPLEMTWASVGDPKSDRTAWLRRSPLLASTEDAAERSQATTTGRIIIVERETVKILFRANGVEKVCSDPGFDCDQKEEKTWGVRIVKQKRRLLRTELMRSLPFVLDLPF